jgi:polar amino acid transport system substrate-binding protein
MTDRFEIATIEHVRRLVLWDQLPVRGRLASLDCLGWLAGVVGHAVCLAKLGRSAVLALLLLLAAMHGALAQASSEAVRNVAVGLKVAPPFVMKTTDGAWTGISVELWNHLAEKLHWHTTFREYQTVPDLLKATASGAVEASISAITVTGERELTVDFSQPFYATGLGVAVPRRRELDWLPIIHNFLSLRFVEAVGILISAAAVVGALIWLVERRHTEHFGNGHRGLGTGLWWSASAMTQAAPQDKAPTTLWGRALATLWMVISVMVIASFTAGITAQLTATRLAGRVQSEWDLGNVRTGSVANTSALSYLRSERISAGAFADIDAALTALQDGRLDAVVYDRPLLAYAVRRNFADTLTVLPVVFDNQNYAIAVPPRSELRTEIDLAMVDDLRTEWWREVLTRYLGPN